MESVIEKGAEDVVKKRKRAGCGNGRRASGDVVEE
jgi:hypothetical protein